MLKTLLIGLITVYIVVIYANTTAEFVEYIKQSSVSDYQFVCFVALHPASTAMVMAGRSVHLTTPFLGKLEQALTSASCTYFRLLLTTTFLD